jgi:uncharacterized membrane protein
MIQRQQTLWLLLATLAALLSFMFPFVVGDEMEKGMAVRRIIDAGSHFILLILTGASLVLSTVIIFLFKDRKMQMRLCLAGLLLSIIIIIVYISEMRKLTHTTLALASVLPFAIIAGYFMAFRNIRKDEKLIKTLDKLR